MIKQMDPSKIALFLIIFLFIPLFNGFCIGGIILIIMSSRKDLMAVIILLSIFEVGFIALTVWLCNLIRKNLKQPEQKTKATIVEKGSYEGYPRRSITHYAVFLLADGTKLSLKVFYKTYNKLKESSNGELCYKARNGEAWFLYFDPIVTQ